MKTNYTFNVGDRVQFKTWEEMEEEFGVYEHKDGIKEIKTKVAFTDIMQPLCGTKASIVRINDVVVVLDNFEQESIAGMVDIIPSKYFYFSLDMLKPVKKGVE